MPDIDSNMTHTRNLSADQQAELRKLVEDDERAAAEMADDNLDTDDDDAGGGEGAGEGADDDGKQAAAAAEGSGASGDDAAAGDKGKGGKAVDAAGKDGAAAADDPNKGGKKPEEGVVTIEQFNGVLKELRDTRGELKALKTNTKLADLPARDFDKEEAEIESAQQALDQQYDDGGELSDEEYRKKSRELNNKLRALDRDRATYEVHAQLLARDEAQQKEFQQAQQAAWDSDVKAWEESLGEWLKNPLRRGAVSQAMELMNQDPETAGLDNAAFLQKLDAYLADEFQSYPRRQAADAAGGVDAKPSPRQLAAAKAAAAGSAQPPVINGGVGNRGTTPDDVDLDKMPLGKFKQLPKEQRAKALGVRVEDL